MKVFIFTVRTYKNLGLPTPGNEIKGQRDRKHRHYYAHITTLTCLEACALRHQCFKLCFIEQQMIVLWSVQNNSKDNCSVFTLACIYSRTETSNTFFCSACNFANLITCFSLVQNSNCTKKSAVDNQKNYQWYKVGQSACLSFSIRDRSSRFRLQDDSMF